MPILWRKRVMGDEAVVFGEIVRRRYRRMGRIWKIT